MSVACRVNVISNGAGCETVSEILDVAPSLPVNPALLKPTKYTTKQSNTEVIIKNIKYP